MYKILNPTLSKYDIVNLEGRQEMTINNTLEYVPVCMLNKFTINTPGYGSFQPTNFENSNLKRSRNYNGAKRTELSNKFNQTYIFNREDSSLLKSIYGYDLLSTQADNYHDIHNDLMSAYYHHSEDLLDINSCAYIARHSTTNHLYSLKCYFDGTYKSNIIQNYTYRSTINKTVLLSNGFIAKDYNNVSANILCVLMIEKDYIEEFYLKQLINDPIDNSKFKWWINSDNVNLDPSWKTFLAHFIKIAKSTPFEIESKQNLNSLIKSFITPTFNNIREVSSFNRDLTTNILHFLYKNQENVPQMPLKLNNEPIISVPVKGIRITKKKIIPELVD